ncbi:Acyltransferase-like protein [Camellia lanceoleosa]|uniref:Acyltransferase-like protein n=1 Tax=Camellia lanceoleosa TaxID=1840588 RepID=A0ACC0GB24_9ERIC|nr:Acyltransferase-like protein [Camellia lanceoleosa]
MLKSASLYVNAHLGAVKAQTLILSSGRDQLLPSEEEGERLLDLIPNCKIQNGKMVRGLEGIPSEGPVLFVGYHMLLVLDTLPMCVKLWAERKIPLRPLAHP